MADRPTGAPTAPRKPAEALPVAQMQEIMTMLRTSDDERLHALHWLVFMQYQNHPMMVQFTWQEAWGLHAKIALLGLLRMAVAEGKTTADVLMGIASAMDHYFRSHAAAVQSWQAFLQTTPGAWQSPTVQSFDQMMQAEAERVRAAAQKASQVFRSIMQGIPVPLPRPQMEGPTVQEGN